MAFSYDDVWKDTVRLTRAHAPLLIAIAGVFIFLPTLIFTVMLPVPEPQTQNAERMFRIFMDYYREAAPWFFAIGLINMVGCAAMLRLVFARDTTVGAALVFGVTLLPAWFAMQIVMTVMLLAGLLLLIVPGLYLMGRLAPVSAVLVAEGRRNPFTVIGRSLELTRGHGWAILGLVLVIAVVGSIVTGVTGQVLGSVFFLALSRDIAIVLRAMVESALSAAFATLLVMLYAAIYRALAPSDRVAEAFE